MRAFQNGMGLRGVLQYLVEKKVHVKAMCFNSTPVSNLPVRGLGIVPEYPTVSLER